MNLTFEPITLERQHEYIERLARSPQVGSDYSFLNVWAWADEYGLSWAWDGPLVWLRQTRPALEEELRRRAAARLEAEGDLVGAVAQQLEVHRWDEAARLIESSAEETLGRGVPEDNMLLSVHSKNTVSSLCERL